VDQVADLELGGAEEVAVSLGGEEVGKVAEVGRRGGRQGGMNAVRFGLLVGGKGEACHGGLLPGVKFGSRTIIAERGSFFHRQ
jgi:hypothetical protein